MRERIAPMTGSARHQARWRWLQALARRGVRRRLRQLEHGGLAIAGASRADSYGGTSDLRAAVTVHCPLFWTDVAFGGTLGAAESHIPGR